MIVLVFVLCFWHKGAWVVVTPDGVWHRDSHYWRKFIGVHKMMILIREELEDVLRQSLGCLWDLLVVFSFFC